jgi:hypothetical protein
MTDEQITNLQDAAKAGRVDVCKSLLEAGVPVDGRIPLLPWDTALSFAAWNGRLEVVDLLLGAGAEVDGRLDDRSTPLIDACISGHLSVVRRLLEAGADLHRESLRQPLTATGTAEYWSFKQEGQPEVASYLRSLGGTNPYFDGAPDAKDAEERWAGAVGEMHIELLERALYGRVSLVPFEREEGSERPLVVRQCRFSANPYLFRLLCTVNAAPSAPGEVAIALPAAWPLHAAALKEQRYAWPLELVFHVARKLQQGASLSHGDLLARDGEILQNAFTPRDIEQWIVVAHRTFEERRIAVLQAGLAPTLLLVPNFAKAIKPKEALAKADAKAQVNWEKPALGTGRSALTVQLPPA